LRTYTLAVHEAMNLTFPLFLLHLIFHMTLTDINLGDWGRDLDGQCCGPPKLILWPQKWWLRHFQCMITRRDTPACKK